MLSKTTLHELRLELDDLRSRAAAIELLIDAVPPHGRGRLPNPESLSGRIREALKQIGGPAKAFEVVEWLERNGVLCNGKKPNSKQVATTLWRMSTGALSSVQRVSSGCYRIVVPEQAEQAVDTEPQDG